MLHGPSMDPSTSMPRTGVCVTGEARSFALPQVRTSLRNLLAALQPVSVIMQLARHGTTTCEGMHLSHNQLACTRMKHMYFDWSETRIRDAFPGVNLGAVTITNRSTCEQPFASSSACCEMKRNITAGVELGKANASNYMMTHEPGVTLQFLPIARCAAVLLDEHPTLQVVVRTRPDLAYLDVPYLALAVRRAVAQPLMGCKGDTKPSRDTPSDMFMAVPGALARQFFDSLYVPVEAACRRRDPHLAWSTMPETAWFHSYGLWGKSGAFNTGGPRLKKELLPVNKVDSHGRVVCMHLKTSWWKICCDHLGMLAMGHNRSNHTKAEADFVCPAWVSKRGRTAQSPGNVSVSNPETRRKLKRR